MPLQDIQSRLRPATSTPSTCHWSYHQQPRLSHASPLRRNKARVQQTLVLAAFHHGKHPPLPPSHQPSAPTISPANTATTPATLTTAAAQSAPPTASLTRTEISTSPSPTATLRQQGRHPRRLLPVHHQQRHTQAVLTHRRPLMTQSRMKEAGKMGPSAGAGRSGTKRVNEAAEAIW